MTLQDNKKMRKRALGFAILVALAAIDFAALDDITTGVQPTFTAEWTTLALSLPIAWLVVRWIRQSARAGASHFG